MNTLNIFELRRYVMQPGRRDELIALFDREFIESQEACGMVPLGHFRDMDDAQSFVWFRGFPSMSERRKALTAFYIDSPVWKAHRAAANATMIDSDNVLLLRPVRPGSAFDLSGLVRPQPGERSEKRQVSLSILMLNESANAAFVQAFEEEVLPELRAIASRIAYLQTCAEPNDFPQLPVREGEFAFVVTGITDDPQWSEMFGAARLPKAMRAQTKRTEKVRLSPAPRSLYGSAR